MSKNKTQKFAELKTFNNAFEEPELFRAQFLERYLQTNAPVTLEVACGRGEYTLELARRHPEIPHVGIDLKGARIWAPAKQALTEGIENVAFIKGNVDTLPFFFKPGEVNQIWITYPDPYPKPCKSSKRLVSPRFLAVYQQILSAEHLLHFKTDHEGLFEFGAESVKAVSGRILERLDDVYQCDNLAEDITIETTFEGKHLADGRTIRYLRFHL
jgi:tRNA (guanine-N7-)-methyltransferase